MKQFRYALDPACALACASYVVNRWWVPLALKGPFLRGHFADVLLIPAALPPLLWLQRRLGLRERDAPPQWSEIAAHVVIWSIAAEALAPLFVARATADPIDALAYACGGILAGLWWRRG